jgi:hypothetical protein
MNQKVSVSPEVNSSFARYAQYLSNAQSSIADAINNANSIRLDLPSISFQISAMSTVKLQLAQLIVDAGNAVNQVTQRDVNNANRILGYGFNGGSIGLPFGTSFALTKVGLETYARAGMNPNAFGTSMEIMSRNQINLNPFKKATLGSGYGIGDDILLNGSLIEVKSGSLTYAKEIHQRVLNGDYAHVKELRVTKEMKGYLDQLGTGDYINIKDTGISNNTVKAAQRTINNVDGATSGLSGAERVALAKDALKNVRVGTYVKAGAIGGVISGGIEAISGYSAWKNGTISGGQYANNIARETTAGVVSSIAATAAVTAVAAAGAPVIATAAVAIGVGIVVGAGVSWLWKKIAG